MITIEAQEAALKTLVADVDGLTRCFTDAPEALQTRDLPVVLLSPRDGAYDQTTGGANSLGVRRQWVASLFVQEASEGREAQAEQAVKPFLTAIPLMLAQHPRVELEDGTEFRIALDNGRDTGPGVLPYANRSYGGAQFFFFTIIEELETPEDEF